MKAMVMFDTYAMPYEIKGELSAITRTAGVSNPILLQKSAGDAPQYCLQIDLEDDKAQSFQQYIKGVEAQYSGQASNFRVLLYRPA